MVDIETFLTALFVLVDDFCQAHPLPPRPGPKWKLHPSEALTLLVFSQWARFRSERDFYRFAQQHLRPLFPHLPSRPQLNRQWRTLYPQVCEVFIFLATLLEGADDLYQVLDLAPVVTRDAKRRGWGWLAGQADIGKSTRLGWYEGLKALLAAYPSGVITGFALAPASTKEQPFAETFFALRAFPHP
ncbi:MAG: IS982 family transposase, partial [Anaerolineae bacterium]